MKKCATTPGRRPTAMAAEPAEKPRPDVPWAYFALLLGAATVLLGGALFADRAMPLIIGYPVEPAYMPPPRPVDWRMRCEDLEPPGKPRCLIRGGEVEVWDTATEKMLASLKGHTDSVTSIAFSGDGKHVISSSQDGTVRIWTWQ